MACTRSADASCSARERAASSARAWSVFSRAFTASNSSASCASRAVSSRSRTGRLLVEDLEHRLLLRLREAQLLQPVGRPAERLGVCGGGEDKRRGQRRNAHHSWPWCFCARWSRRER